MTIAEKFYIDSHPAKTDEELAEELGMSVEDVVRAREGRKKPTKLGKFQHNDGTVVMTAAQSMRDDKSSSPTIPPAWKDCVHIIDP
jgi:DNA-directed RNA polymerase specialized sigma subunit